MPCHVGKYTPQAEPVTWAEVHFAAEALQEVCHRLKAGEL